MGFEYILIGFFEWLEASVIKRYRMMAARMRKLEERRRENNKRVGENGEKSPEKRGEGGGGSKTGCRVCVSSLVY